MEDIFDVGAPDDGAPALAELHDKVEQAFRLQEAIENTEEDLKQMKNRLQILKTGVPIKGMTKAGSGRSIPEIMSELGIDKITTKDGVKVTVKSWVSGNLPKTRDERNEALAWIYDNGGKEIIKSTVTMKFGVKEHNIANSITEELRERGLDVDMVDGVHSSTLHAFVREKMENGEAIDTDLLGLYVGRSAWLGKE